MAGSLEVRRFEDGSPQGGRSLLTTFPDGEQILVTEWATGYIEVARRDDASATWGPPVTGKVGE